ncbi:hypothetical protein [Rossellomorea sp. BNER]|uniref:hypothetical protein n=1 Tax=Rossellomorea sp. BNER TaxID=2962031 RepID=UPI003AF2CED1|nr:hypothetical protein [Rossellomorea sp. BNER]
MSHQKDTRHYSVPHKNQIDRFNNKDDTYGIFKENMEVDTDVNEDPNRERLLDESVETFLESKKDM